MNWWRTAGSVGGIVMALVAVSLCVDPLGWDEAVAWAEARERSWRGANAECPVLVGEGREGSSHAGYAAAVALLHAAGPDIVARVTEVASGGADAELLQAVAPAVAALRDAAQRCGGPHTWPAADLEPDASAALVDVLPLVDALRATARAQAAAGDADAALRCLADGVAVGVDLAHSMIPIEQMLGVLGLDRVLATCDDALLASAGADALQTFAAALAAADAVLPPVSRILGDDVAAFALSLERHANWAAHHVGLPTSLLAWQSGFSVRRLAMQRAARAIAVVARFEAATRANEGWQRRRARLVALAEELRTELRPLPAAFVDHFVAHEERYDEVRTQLRLLRLAVAWRAGAASPELADPFGDAPLRVIPTADGVVFASERDGLQRAAFGDR